MEHGGLKQILLAGLVIIAGGYCRGAAEPQTDAGVSNRPAARYEFVGSQVCAQCHPANHQDWLASQHAHAMQDANDETVLGNFANATFTHEGVVTTFFKKDHTFWVRTDGPDGKLADFEIRYTFGISPLQQYLIELPGGRIQALGIAWDARPKEEGGQRWYHLYPDRNLAAGEPLHWTGLDQNWNYQCAWCHSTNLRKNYNAATRQFNTTWSEINVGCEACHGPASRHVAWASGADQRNDDTAGTKGFPVEFDERKATTWKMGESGQATRSPPLTTNKEINVCAGCHSRRGQFSDDPNDVASPFDAFRPALLDRGLFHVDGQQHDEVYTVASFMQSKMFAAGVTCSDCHNPHSGKTRMSGNAVCTQCHAAERFDAPSHHHHASNSEGAQCVSCHAPTAVYMGVDARHDHSFRIPRPDRTVVLGTPNACNQCHKDKSATWAKDAIRIWFPSPNPGAQSFAEGFSRADLRAPGAHDALAAIVRGQNQSSIARASALGRLNGFQGAEILELASQSLAIDDPLVQSAAIAIVAGADAETRRNHLIPLLTNKVRLVRMDAARALAGEAEEKLPPDARTVFDAALAEYVAAQLFNAERPEAQANLGALYREQGKIQDARTAFETAISLDPTFFTAAIALADLLRTSGDEAAAEKVLQKSLAANPGAGALQHAIGLSLIRQRRTDEAMTWLTKAAESAPDEARYSYVLAVAMHDTGKPAEAVEILRNALVRSPYDRELLMALSSYEIERGDVAAALEHAQLLEKLEPGRPDVTQLLSWLKRRQSQTSPDSR